MIINKLAGGKILLKLRKFIVFFICIFIFPQAVKALRRSLKILGLNSFAERTFLYIMSMQIPVEGDILEIGSFKGNSSLMLTLGNESSIKMGKVWFVEPCPRPNKDSFLNDFKFYGLDKHVELVDKTSEDARCFVNSQFRFIFIDADHKCTEKDILLWQDSLKEGGVIAFHDCTAREVSKAVDELILRSDKYTMLGTVGGILYASRGCFNDNRLLCRLKTLTNMRNKLTLIGKRLRLYW